MNAYIIDADKIRKNIKTVRERAGERKLYAVVKGNGYGFGLSEYVKILIKEGISAFAVTEPEDAETIRALDNECEILCLRSTEIEAEAERLIMANAVLTVGTLPAGNLANALAKKLGKARYPIHIKIDTGMGRYGFFPEEYENITGIFKYMPELKVEGMYTHLNSAFLSKKKTMAQIDAFSELELKLIQDGFNPGCVHFANSSTLFRFGGIDFGNAVRIGSALTGRLPVKVRGSNLDKVGVLESTVCQTRWVGKGTTFGYGGVFTAKKPMRVAVLPIGFSHGFACEKIRDTYRFSDGIRYLLQDLKRILTNEKLYVEINSKRARVLGHVGMLHTTIDITDIECEAGDKAILNASPLYINPSLPRRYINL